jgi:hypothetical protein
VSPHAGPHCEGQQLLDAIEANMRKEYTLEGVYQVRGGASALARVFACARGCVHAQHVLRGLHTARSTRSS